MFLRLFLIECRQTLKSATYYIILICILLFYVSQCGSFEIIKKPVPNQEKLWNDLQQR